MDWSEILLATNPTAGPGWVSIRKSVNGPVACVATVSKSIGRDPTKLMIQSVISTPMPDLVADRVEPRLFDKSYHNAVRTVLYDHGQDYKLPVGLAEDPAGNYTVRLAGDRLVADTYFAANKMGEDLYDLCDKDVLRGWSVTFTPNEPGFPVGPFNKAINRCPMQFGSVKLIEYSVTPNPINVEALTILAEKGRAGNGPFHAVIQKSLSAYAKVSRPASVQVPPHVAILPRIAGRVGKSMADEPNAGDAADMAPPTETAAHGYDLAQGLSDIHANGQGRLDRGEHVKGKKKLKKIYEDILALVDEAKAVGDMVSSELDDKPDEQDAMVDDPEPVEKSADGLILVKKSHYQPKRWTARDLAAAEGSAVAIAEPTRKSRAERQRERDERDRQRELAALRENLKKYPNLIRPTHGSK